MKAVLFILLLAACTQTDEGAKNIQWTQLEDIRQECKDDVGFDVSGCSKWRGDTSYVYTKQAKNETDKAVHLALGHEVRHCFQGEFHARLSY